jgi:hypothetical protein
MVRKIIVAAILLVAMGSAQAQTDFHAAHQVGCSRLDLDRADLRKCEIGWRSGIHDQRKCADLDAGSRL